MISNNEHNVHHFTSYPYTPLGIIKRFNKTIKTKIFSYMQINQTGHYIGVLNELVQNYNKTRHSTIQEQLSYVHFCDQKQKDYSETQGRVYKQLQHIDEKIIATISQSNYNIQCW